MSIVRESAVKPKLDTGLKSRKNLKMRKPIGEVSVADNSIRTHEDASGSNPVMKVKITTKPKLDSGSFRQKTRDPNNPNQQPLAIQDATKRVTIADLCEEEKSKVYNIIEQLVTLTNDHETTVAQMTREKEQYDAELSALHNSFSTHLLPIEEAMRHKDESIISLETKNHMILAMLALYQAKIQNMSDITQFQVTTEADLQTRITLFKNEVDHVKGLNNALQQRIDNMETMSSASTAVVAAAAHKAEQNVRHLEATLESERRSMTEVQSRCVSLQNHIHQMQIELDNARSDLSAASRGKAMAEALAAKWKTIAEGNGSSSGMNSNNNNGAVGGVLQNPYRRQSAATAGVFDEPMFSTDSHQTAAPVSDVAAAAAAKKSESEPSVSLLVGRKKPSRRASTGGLSETNTSSEVMRGSVTGLLSRDDEQLLRSSAASNKTQPKSTTAVVVVDDARQAAESSASAGPARTLVKKKKASGRVVCVNSAVPPVIYSEPAAISGSSGNVTGGQPQRQTVSGVIEKSSKSTAASVGQPNASKSVVVVMPTTTAGAAAVVPSKKNSVSGNSGANSGNASRRGTVDYDLKLFDVLGQM